MLSGDFRRKRQREVTSLVSRPRTRTLTPAVLARLGAAMLEVLLLGRDCAEDLCLGGSQVFTQIR